MIHFCSRLRQQPLLWAAVVTLAIVAVLVTAACGGPQVAPTPTPVPLPEELILYNWVGYMPQAVLDAFTAEYGVQVSYVAYDTQEEAIANMDAGQVYDVVVMGNEFLPHLLEGGLLAEIDYRNIPNFKNIAAEFRDLAYDPDNKHSVPFLWGTTGLLVRTDQVTEPVTRWADLWDPRYAGRVAIWELKDPMVPITLKTLGYSINSEDPAELEAAAARLIELKPNAILWPPDEVSILPALTEGQALIAVGWAYDAMVAQEADPNIDYVLPEDGTVLWNDNLVIPANSPNKHAAELFLNFLLRPEIGAQVVNELYYASANQAVTPYVAPEIAANPLVFPPRESLTHAEVILPRSSQGEQLFNQVWDRFLAAKP